MTLEHRIAVYVPSRNKDGRVPTLHKKWLRATLKRLATLFGGATATMGEGAWVNKGGKLILERIAICYSFTDAETLAANQGKVFALVRVIATRMQQEAVSVEVDGVLHFVTATDLVAAA